jgi:hypothetical protein
VELTPDYLDDEADDYDGNNNRKSLADRGFSRSHFDLSSGQKDFYEEKKYSSYFAGSNDDLVLI